jgi:hypothetical protein
MNRDPAVARRQDQQVLKAARRWWRGKRPVSWKQRQHLENPTVNCVGDWEHQLAKAVAKSLRPIG